MRNVSDNSWNSTKGSSLYCVWVSVHDVPRDRLVAIWIDPAMTAFNSRDPEITDGNGTAASAAEHEDREEEKLGNAIG
jgi:hypothetical protein